MSTYSRGRHATRFRKSLSFGLHSGPTPALPKEDFCVTSTAVRNGGGRRSMNGTSVFRRCVGPALAVAVLLLATAPRANAADDAYSGSDLWLHYTKVTDPVRLDAYRAAATTIVVD